MRRVAGWIAAGLLMVGAAGAQEQEQLQDNWLNCLVDFSTLAARATTETADTISRGAFIRCQDHENAYYRFLTEGRDPAVAEMTATQLFPAVKEMYADSVIEAVLSARL